MALQIRRGTNYERLGFTPVAGEVVYVTDSQLSTATAVTIASNVITTAVDHGLAINQKVKYIGNNSNGLVEGTIYYVLSTSFAAATFKVSLTLNGTAVTLTNGTGLSLLFAKTPVDATSTPYGYSIAPVWVGDGLTAGGIATGAATLDELSDVTIDGFLGVALANNQHLQFDGVANQWRNVSNVTVPGTLVVNGNANLNGAITTIGDQLTDQIILGTSLVYAPNNLAINGASANHVFVEYATGFVGIGDGTPSYKLDVNGAIRTTSNLWVNGNTNLGDGSADSVTINASTVDIPNNLSFDTDLLKLDSANNRVGINQATPSQALDVIGNGKFSGNLHIVAGAITTDSATASLFNSTASTVAIAGAATTVTIGNSGGEAGGTTTIRNNATINGDFQVGASAQFTVDAATGDVRVLSATESTNQDSGSLQIDGGVGINKRLNVGGNISVDSTTASTTPTNGSIQTDGGLGVVGAGNFGSDVRIDSTTAATSTITGSLQTDGGLGVVGDVYIGGSVNLGTDLIVAGNLTVNGTTTTLNTETLSVEDKNIELGVVATSTDITANGGGITLKNAETGDKSIIWYSATNNWEFSNGVRAPEATVGNVSIASGSNNNTITTITGNLILDAATNIVEVNADITQTGNLTTSGITSGAVTVGLTENNTITTTSGELILDAAGSRILVNNVLDVADTTNLMGNVTLGAGSTDEIYFTGLVDGNIGFKQPVSGPRGITGSAGGNDMWFVGGSQTGVDAGYAMIATADNGNEPIYARQFPTNADMLAGTNPTRTLTLLSETGDTVLPGSLTLGADGYIYSTTDLAIDVTGANVRVAGDLTISGNDIKSSADTTVFTLSGVDATVAGDLTITSDLDVNGTLLDGITLEQAFVFGWDENNSRTNRPTFQSSTGNTSGVRVTAPNATSSARASVGAFTTNDINNGKFINLEGRNTTNPLRIQSGQYIAGVASNTTESIAFTNFDGTPYATVNPGSINAATDLITKSYLDTEVDLLQDGTTAFTTVNLNAVANIKTRELVTSATTADQTLASWSAATFRSAKYQIQIESGTDFQTVEAVVIHNGTTAYITIYADVKTGSVDLATIGVTLLSGNVLLQVTPANAITTFRAVETAIKKS